MGNKLFSPTGKRLVLRPTRANAGIQADYRRRLDALVAEMNASILYWIKATYRANQPEIAQDDSPARALRAAMRKMARQWQRNFDKGAEKLAKHFADSAMGYGDTATKAILKDAGFTVEFKMTPEANDVYQAIIGENVGLIKSIAERNLGQVETLVMQSVQRGRDLGSLTWNLEQQFGVTHRRAAFIARDQNNKATSVINAVRQRSLGIKQGKWRHSGGGRKPRHSHVLADGKLFDLDKGMYIDGEWIMPGEKIGCGCTWAPVIEGFID